MSAFTGKQFVPFWIAISMGAMTVWFSSLTYIQNLAVPFGDGALFSSVETASLSLGGKSLLCVLACIIPEFMQKHRRVIDVAVICSAFAGSLMILYSTQPVFVSHRDTIVLGSVFALGTAYSWYVVRLYSLLSTVSSYKAAVWCVASILILQTAGTAFADSLFNLTQFFPLPLIFLIVCGITLVFASLPGSRESEVFYVMGRAGVWELQGRSAPKKALIKYLAIFLLSADLLMTTMHSIVAMGITETGGFTHSPTPNISVIFVIAEMILLVIIVYVALIRTADKKITDRYITSFLIVMTGIFVITLLFEQVRSDSIVPVILLSTIELYSHLLLWVVAVAVIRLSRIHPFQIISFLFGLYGVVVFFWTTAIQQISPLPSYVIPGLMYLVVVVSFVLMKHRENSEEVRDAVNRPLDDLKTILIEKGKEIAKKYKLSPRETDVFLLLIQGKTRKAIQRELFLSDGTVKTHSMHIYTKLGVNSREELISLVYDTEQASIPNGN